MKKIYIMFAAILVLGCASSFYGGYAYSQSKIPKRGGQFFQAFQTNGNNRQRVQMGNGVAGQITKIDNQSMTVQQPDGSSKIVFYSDSTSVQKSAQGTKSDLAAGMQVMITGSANSDGSYTANMIRINNGDFTGNNNH